jgi:hypothetical protein
MRRAASLAAAAVLCVVPAASAATPAPDRYDLANRCWNIGAKGGGGASLDRLFLEPTGLGTYLFMNRDDDFLAANGRRVGIADAPGPEAVWKVRGEPGSLRIAAKKGGRGLRLG